MRKRCHRVQVRLDEHELEHFKNQIIYSGLAKEGYLRKLIMGKEIKPRAPQEYQDLLREVRATGNNINQAVKIANTEKAISYQTIAELLQMQRHLLSLVKGLI